jgi:hypothetical protein
MSSWARPLFAFWSCRSSLSGGDGNPDLRSIRFFSSVVIARARLRDADMREFQFVEDDYIP